MKKLVLNSLLIIVLLLSITKTYAQSFGSPLASTGWYQSQNFGVWNSSFGGYHLGEDYVSNNNIELPVYSVSNGTVKHVASHTDYGYVVVIEHQLNDNSKVCSVYGHMRAANITYAGKSVTKGELIGYMSNSSSENGGYKFTHLHFGIRSSAYSEVLDSDAKWRYRGYGPSSIRDLWYDGSEFIGSHQTTTLPILSGPTDNLVTIKGSNFTFFWTSVTNAIYYEIWIDNNSVFGSPEIGFNNGVSPNWINNGIVSSNNFTLTAEMQNQLPQNSYSWKVRSLDGNQNPITAFSDIRSFILLDNVPAPPILSAPTYNSELIKGNNISFTWTGLTNASYYEIWIDNNSGFGSPEVGFNNGESSNWINDGIVSSNTFTLTNSMQNQLPQNLYYWKVRTLDISKNPLTDWSTSVLTFKLLDKPSPPILSAPTDNSELIKGNNTSFTWTSVSNASYYEVWIDNSSGFGNPEIGFNNGTSSNWVNDGIVSSNTFTLTSAMQNQLPQNLYYWKVRALDISKNPLTDWSTSVRSFKLLDHSGSKTVQINTAGTLSSVLTATELATVTDLTITGTLDARDFKTMRDAMPVLASIDLSTVTITAYTGTEGTDGITFTAYPTNEVPIFAFFNRTIWKGKTTLINIKFPSSITSIGMGAFDYCSGLNTVIIPSSVISIGDLTFFHCIGLKSVTIPAGVVSIGGYAFNDCISLTSIYANDNTPVSLSSVSFVFDGVNKNTCTLYVPIGSKSAYQSANQWKEFTNIVEAVQLTPGTLSSVLTANELATINNLTITGTIDARDFKTMRDAMPVLASIDLSSVTISNYTGIEGTGYPNNLVIYPANELPQFAFYNQTTMKINTTLNSIKLPVSVTSIGSNAFTNCSGLIGSFVISNTVTSINSQAFQNTVGLTSISIGNSVNWVGEWAFAFKSTLTSIYIYAEIPPVVGGDVFPHTNVTACILYVPTGTKTIYQNAREWSKFTNIIEMTTAVNDPLANNPIIYSQNGALHIENVEANSSVNVYDISGRIRYSEKLQNSSVRVELNKGAIYFVKINDKSYKIML